MCPHLRRRSSERCDLDYFTLVSAPASPDWDCGLVCCMRRYAVCATLVACEMPDIIDGARARYGFCGLVSAPF